MKKIRKNNRLQKQNKQTGTIFDDVFRTMAQKLPELFIPLINEVFHTDYPEDEPLVQMRNEHLEKFGKVITDSIFNIREHLYHVACQSTRDGHMSLRMLEYDIAIALENLSNASGKPKLNFPESCVLYIREQQKPPEPLEAEIVFPDGQSVDYTYKVHLKVTFKGYLFLKSIIHFNFADNHWEGFRTAAIRRIRKKNVSDSSIRCPLPAAPDTLCHPKL